MERSEASVVLPRHGLVPTRQFDDDAEGRPLCRSACALHHEGGGIWARIHARVRLRFRLILAFL